MEKSFNYGTGHLTIGTCLGIASGKVKGVIGPAAHANIRSSWLEVTKIVEREIPVYGINTGFGPLCNTHIPEKDTCTLQYNLLKSHSVGVGKPIPTEIAKLMLITKVHALAQGYSGISHRSGVHRARTAVKAGSYGDGKSAVLGWGQAAAAKGRY